MDTDGFKTALGLYLAGCIAAALVVGVVLGWWLF
jgi:hypothetical protein